MTDKFLSSIIDPTQSISFDPSALLTTSTINALHFPDLMTSGISDSGAPPRTTTLNLEGVGMCESMTESYCSTHGQDDTVLINTHVDSSSMNTSYIKNHNKKDLTAQKKRRSRKAQFDAATDGFSLDKIETVQINDEQLEADDAWLFQIPGGNPKKSSNENIFSWVHKEFKENDINANKHRLLCKLDDMSHARTIRSISCHSFPANQRSDSVKRSSTEQQVNPEPVQHSRLTSPLRSSTPQYNPNGSTRPTSPAGASPLRHTVAITNTIRSRDVSREREPLDFTDLEVMAKVQLENLRQAERQGPLSKRFGGSSSTLLISDSRDVSPVSVFGATRNTSPVSHTGRMTPRQSYSPSPALAGQIPIRKNSFVVTESQYAHVLPSVSPRSSSPAVRTGQWSGRNTPSALETWMETSIIETNNSISSNTPEQMFDDDAQDRPGNKPPAVPKSVVPRNGVKPNNHRRSNTQTIVPSVANGFEIPDVTETKPTTRPAGVMPPNARTRLPPAAAAAAAATTRPVQAYRGSQTTFNNTMTLTTPQSAAAAPASVQQRPAKKPNGDLGSTFTARQFAPAENTFLNDVSNQPLTNPMRSQVVNQRRSLLPQQSSADQVSTSIDTTGNFQSSIPRSASSLSQGRKSGIPTIGKQIRPNPSTMTRPTASNVIPSSQSSDSMMMTRNIRPQTSITRPQIPDTMSPTSSWNEGCY